MGVPAAIQRTTRSRVCSTTVVGTALKTFQGQTKRKSAWSPRRSTGATLLERACPDRGMGGHVEASFLGLRALVAESAKHFARVPGPWPGTY
jgi:hypothetical protein